MNNFEILMEHFYSEEYDGIFDYYIASIPEMKGMVVQGKNIADCLRKLATSFEVLELHESDRSKE
jgi:predicted RNase H-like HicB family nuclease